jgi:hypothetical protein
MIMQEICSWKCFCEEIAKEGPESGRNYATGTSKALPM